jgi:hypothetical protein
MGECRWCSVRCEVKLEDEMRKVILGIAIVAACAGSLHAQDLGQAAAKEKERRAKIGASAKPLTEDDLKEAGRKRAKEGTPSSGGSPSASPSPGGNGAALKAKDPDPAADAGGSEDSKKARAAVYKARLEAANAQLKRAEDELKAAQAVRDKVNTHPNLYVAGSIDDATAILEVAKKHVEQARRVRDDIEDEARREGIPPGYLR